MSSDTPFLKRLRMLPRLVSGSFSRPADTITYAAGDLMANSTTTGSVVPVEVVAGAAGATVMLRRMTCRKNGTLSGNAVFRIHVFTTAPTVGGGDNTTLTIATGMAGYVASFNVGAIRAGGDGVVGFATPDVGTDVAVVLGSAGKLYCLMEALAAYPPPSGETYTLTFEVASA